MAFIMSLQNLFKSFIGKNEILSVYCNPDDKHSAIVGFAKQIDDDYMICNSVTRYGKYDGYLLRKTENIFRVDYGSHYETSLFRVFTHHKQSHKEIPSNNTVFINYIQFAKDSGFVAYVGIRDHDDGTVSGYIDEIDFDSETFTIHIIAREREGAFDGFTVVSFDDVYYMCCDTEFDRYFQKLNQLTTETQ